MPDPSAGHELMRRLTARNPTLSDALLTGYGFPICVSQCNIVDVVKKPPVRDICAQKGNSHNSPWDFPDITSVGISRIQSSLVGGTNHHPHTILIALSKRDKTTVLARHNIQS
ncbi:hypothetical protein PIB30_099033, partial [Stylosanthes scabra]|nr:hypothetical protein [Stylosanthes scabra]